MKRNDGFTLVELVVAIAASSLVTIAAVSLLLLGARTQKISLDDAGEQQTTRIVLSLLEEMAGRGTFNRIEPTNDGWHLLNCANPAAPQSGDTVVFSYKEGSIYRVGTSGEETLLLSGLKDAAVNMEPNNVVRLAFETAQGGSYVTRVHCRTMDILEGADTSEDSKVEDSIANDKVTDGNVDTNVKDSVTGDEVAKRIAFLQTLAGEYLGGANTGRIHGNGQSYSEWYLNAVYGSGYDKNPGWNANTPWCACFLSWAAMQDWSHAEGQSVNKAFVFANVDDGMARFKLADKWKDKGQTPYPGDYIFFDWSGGTNPSHVGVVLDVDDTNDDGSWDTVYTIEGNSANKVAVRVYRIDDDAIIGYGVLPAFNP